jgi:lipid-binding SYLF domain-containing protein
MENSMNRLSKRSAIVGFGLFFAFFITASAAFGQEKFPLKRADDAARHAADSAKVFNEIMSTPGKAIPKSLIDKAEAIAVFPGTLKAAFVFGGRAGQGVISRKLANGWSAPTFFNIGGGSFGAQIGATKTDIVLLIMNEDGINGLLKDKFELGAEAGVAAGPVGREAAGSTDALLQAGILSYSRSKGLFAGISLKGSYVSPDNNFNEAFYGRKGEELIKNPTPPNQTPPQVKIFPQTLAKYM